MRPLELEYKYNAQKIELKDFTELMTVLQYDRRIDVSSWDAFFTNHEKETKFLRYRMSENNPQLTVKVKVDDSNNWKRVEVNIPLDPNTKPSLLEFTVEHFVQELGFTKNFKIYKSCFIFWFDNYNYVYYTVYDENMKELGRFIEVEFDEEKVHVEFTESEAFDILKEAEQKLSKLGITSKNRLKKSLYEMFRK